MLPRGKLGFLLLQRGAEAAHRRRCGLAHGDRRGRRIAAPLAPARRGSRSRAVGAEVDVHPASRRRVAFDWAFAHGDRRGRRIAAPLAPARRDSRSRAIGAEVDVHPASRRRVAFDWASDVGWGGFGAVAPRTRRRGGSVGPTGPADAESGAGNGPGDRPRAT